MSSDISTALPELLLAPGTTITVDTGDAAAVVTLLNVYGFTPEREPEETVAPFVPQFTYGPG